MNWDNIKNWLFHPQTESAWLLQLFAVVFITLSINFFWKIVHARFAKSLTRTRTLWDDALWEALRGPVGWMIWVLGISISALVIPFEAGPVMLKWINKTRDISLVVIFTWFVFRFISAAEKNLLDQFVTEPKIADKYDPTTINAIAKLFRASVVITAVMAVLQTLNIDITGVIAFGGIGGLAVGLAAKDLLANFFGGLTIYLDRPFKVGDWIKSPDRSIEGSVEYIGWRQTRIRTFDQRPLYVPNAVFTSIAVENPSRMLNRRIYETIGVRYKDANKLPEIISKVKQMLQLHDEIDQNQTLIVNFNQFSPSSLDFFIYTFTKTTNWVFFHSVKQDVLMKTLNIVHSLGGDVAFPSSSLYVEKFPMKE